MTFLGWLTNFAVVHDYLVYVLLVFAGFIEGPILGLICGMLYSGGYIDLIPAYIALMIGDLCGDIFWYSMGRFVGNRFVERYGRYFSIHQENVRVVEHVFHKYSDWILIISKLTAGFGFALVTLVTAGLVKIPFRRYITINVLGQFIWTAMLMAVGYEFASLYATFNDAFSRMFLISTLVLVCAAFIGLGKYVRDRMTRASKI